MLNWVQGCFRMTVHPCFDLQPTVPRLQSKTNGPSPLTCRRRGITLLCGSCPSWSGKPHSASLFPVLTNHFDSAVWPLLYLLRKFFLLYSIFRGDHLSHSAKVRSLSLLLILITNWLCYTFIIFHFNSWKWASFILGIKDQGIYFCFSRYAFRFTSPILWLLNMYLLVPLPYFGTIISLHQF